MLTTNVWRLIGLALISVSFILGAIIAALQPLVGVALIYALTAFAIFVIGFIYLIASLDQPKSIAVHCELVPNPNWPAPRFALDAPAHVLLDGVNPLISGLKKNELRLDPYTDDSMPLLEPQWNPRGSVSGYFEFNLHTLRFLVPLLDGVVGNVADRVDQCEAILRHWLQHNPFKRAPKFHECYRNIDASMKCNSSISCAAWADEHAVAWRAVTIAHARHQWDTHALLTPARESLLASMVTAHGDYLVRQSNYRYEHNHGLSNALALLAISTSFPSHKSAPYWLGLGIQRVEQQMKENVSDDGIHLEQSGFYHFYTLRSFVEALYGLQYFGLDLSASFKCKLAKMLDAACWMLNSNGTVDSLPYSDARIDLLKFVDESLLSRIGLGKYQPAIDRYLRRISGVTTEDGLNICEHGGFAILKRSQPDSLMVTFHTRTLHAGHAHQDPLGIVVSYAGHPVICMTSKLRMPNESSWQQYFHSIDAHNTVTIRGLDPEVLPQATENDLSSRLLHSYKLTTLAWRTGIIDLLIAARRVLGKDIIPLSTRSNPRNGTVLRAEASDEWSIVLAQHNQYAECTHYRAVVELHGCVLVIWDRLKSKVSQTFIQRFHIASDISAEDCYGGIWLMRGDKLLARTYQLKSDVKRLHGGERYSWFFDGKIDAPLEIEQVAYQAQGKEVEFVWVVLFGQTTLVPRLNGETLSFYDDPRKKYDIYWRLDNASNEINVSRDGVDGV